MKNTLIKFYITSFCFLASFAMFAQPGDNSDTSDVEGADAPAAPINGKLFFLAIAGIIFAYYTFRIYRKQQII